MKRLTVQSMAMKPCHSLEKRDLAWMLFALVQVTWTAIFHCALEETITVNNRHSKGKLIDLWMTLNESIRINFIPSIGQQPKWLVQLPIGLPPKSSITLIVYSKGRQAEKHVIFVYQPRKRGARLDQFFCGRIFICYSLNQRTRCV